MAYTFEQHPQNKRTAGKQSASVTSRFGKWPRRARSSSGGERQQFVERLESRVLLAGNGLLATYYDNANFTGPSVTRVDPTVNYNFGRFAPVTTFSPNTWSARWTGQVQAQKTETYTFYTQADDGVRLWVNGKLLIDDWNNHTVSEKSGSIDLLAGQKYDIGLEYYQYTGLASVKLLWSSPTTEQQTVPQSALYTSGRTGRDVFGGTAPTAGDAIEAENFDRGAEGVTYHDLEAGNIGLVYRASGVDLTGLAGGGVGVTSMQAGEWLEYTIDVPTAGTYDLNMTWGSAGGGTVHVAFGGEDKTGAISIPVTGSDDMFTTVTKSGIALAAGIQVMRLMVDATGTTASAGILDVIKFVPTTQRVTTGTVLVPGEGFAGATPQPGPVGMPGQLGYGQSAIARWDVVPYQTFSTTMNVGVVAFDIGSIDRVEFSVNGGKPVGVTEMTLNPETNVVEYWVTLDATKFASDGPIEVRAVAYPAAGVPRVLEGLALNVNKNGTLNERYVYVSPTGDDATADGTAAHPYQTLLAAAVNNSGGAGHRTAADNVTLYCEPGDYAWPAAVWYMNPFNSTGWMTVSAAPGADPATVRITSFTPGSSGFNTPLVRLNNLTIGNGVDSVILLATSTNPRSLWLDNVNWAGAGPAVNVNGQLTNGFAAVYYTDSFVHDTSANVNGILVRNCRVDNAVIAYQNVGMLINSSASNLTVPAGTNFHSDVLQYYQTSPGWGNVIIYGLTATEGQMIAQGITLGPASFRDVAIVNCNVAVTSVMTAFSAQSSTQNLLIFGSRFSGPVTGWLPSNNGIPFTASDVLIRDSIFPPNTSLLISGVMIR